MHPTQPRALTDGGEQMQWNLFLHPRSRPGQARGLPRGLTDAETLHPALSASRDHACSHVPRARSGRRGAGANGLIYVGKSGVYVRWRDLWTSLFLSASLLFMK